jgi:alpha-L-fucosidase
MQRDGRDGFSIDAMVHSLAAALALLLVPAAAPEPRPSAAAPADRETVKAEHSQIGVGGETVGRGHTAHPDAQWFPEAGFGLFIHWGISSVKAMNISWPMIPGRPLAAKRIESQEERDRIVRESDYNLDGKPPAITPNQYWAMAKDFDPQAYDPDKWMKAAKDAGFKYVVLTARHHEGFALWPSAYGELNTKTYMGGRDLIKPYVEACRRHGLKVGLYYSPPDWYFDREYMSFLYHGARRNNPELPSLDADLKPRVALKSAEETRKHQEAYVALVRGQIEELLTRYGTIDVLWFDGKPAVPDPAKVMTAARLRELQPGIVLNPRLVDGGDYVTWERTFPAKRPDPAIWGEYCNTWTTSWSHQEIPFRDPAFILGQLARARAWGINYLLGVGPMASGEMSEGVYRNMAIVADWMKGNRASVEGVKPLPDGETASVPATAKGDLRYLFVLPPADGSLKPPADPATLPPLADETVTLAGVGAKPKSAVLLASGKALELAYKDGVVTVTVPAALRTRPGDVAVVSFR